jgi:hypothetical protein
MDWIGAIPRRAGAGVPFGVPAGLSAAAQRVETSRQAIKAALWLLGQGETKIRYIRKTSRLDFALGNWGRSIHCRSTSNKPEIITQVEDAE